MLLYGGSVFDGYFIDFVIFFLVVMILYSRKNFFSEWVIWFVENGKIGMVLININFIVGFVSIFCKIVFLGVDGYIKSNYVFIFSLKNLWGIVFFKMDFKSDKLDYVVI